MNKEELFRAIAEIDPEQVEQAQSFVKKPKPPVWIKWGAMAACAVIVVGALVALPALRGGNPQTPGKAQPAGTAVTTTAKPGDPTVTEPTSTDEPSDVHELSDLPDEPSNPTTAPSDKTTVKTGITTVKPGTTTAKPGTTTTRPTGRTTPDDKPTTTRTTAGTTKPTTPPTTKPTAKPTTKPTTRPTHGPVDPISEVSSAASEEPSEEPAFDSDDYYDVPTRFDGIRKTLAAYPDQGENPYYTYWNNAKAALAVEDGMSDYYQTIMRRLLPSDDENTVCSPLNTYVAFSMLAEVTGGNSRQQVLDMLGVSDIRSLRSQIDTIWQANYADTTTFKSLLGNSVWLKKGVPYSSDTLDRLATTYHASSFIGTPGTSEMDSALRNWTNENTGGLLSPYVNGMKTDPDMVARLVSTLYFKAPWSDPFDENATNKATFHGTRGDTTVDMMHGSELQYVYRGKNFTAVALGLRYGGHMFFLLPDQGVNVNSLLSDPNLMSALQYNTRSDEWNMKRVYLSLPKFSVSAKTDLIGTLRALGVTDVFDPYKSDFTPLTSDRTIVLDKANHAAVVEIDEEGVTGAAYTDLDAVEAAAPERITLVFDRPFLFTVSGADGSILFSGVVRNIA